MLKRPILRRLEIRGQTLKSASEPEIPLTLELKERAGHDAPPAAALDRFEREWS